MGVPAGWNEACALSGFSSPTWKSAALPGSSSSPSATLIFEGGMVPPSEPSLDVAEPCLPSSQACGLEDSEPGRSWPGQRKEGGGAGRTEKEGRWTLRVTRSLWGVEETGKLLYRASVFTCVQWAEYLLYKQTIQSCVRLFVIPWTVAYQAPPSMGFSRQQ